MSNESSSQCWRCSFRVSVRGLVVFILVIGAGLGCIVRQAESQRNVIAAIRKADGFAIYDWERLNRKLQPIGKPWAPRWLVDILGVDFFGHVVSVSLAPKTDVDAIHVECLSGLEGL